MGGARTALVAVGAVVCASAPAQAAQWQPAQQIQTGNAAYLDLAVGRDGNAALTWESNYSVMASFRPVGGAFSTPVMLDERGDEPQVEVDGGGEVTFLWESGDGAIKTAVRPAGGALGPTLTLRAAPSQEEQKDRMAALPRLEVAPGGAAVAAWIVNGRAEGSLRPAGGQFGAPESITETKVWLPLRVGIDDSGRAVVLYEREYRESFNATREPGTLVLWADPTRPEYVTGRAGSGWNAPAVWELEPVPDWEQQLSVAPTGATILADRLATPEVGVTVGTTEDPDQRHDRVGAVDGNNANMTSVAFDSHGRAYVFWRSHHGDGRQGHFVAERAPGASDWSAPAEIPAPEVETLAFAGVGWEGDLAYAYYQRNPKTFEPGPLHALVRPAGGTFSSGRALGEMSVPGVQVGVSGSSLAVVAWANSSGLRAAAYDDAASPAPTPTPSPAPEVDELPPRCDLDALQADPISFVLDCNEVVHITATASLVRSGAAGGTRLSTLKRRFRGTGAKRVALRIAKGKRKLFRRTLEERGRARIRVRVVATDAADNSRVITRKLSILAPE